MNEEHYLARLKEALKKVIDPEVGVNIMDLGLVYHLHVREGSPPHVLIEYTMTSPSCPLGEYMEEQIRDQVAEGLDPSPLVDIRIVWTPPWDHSRMSAEARSQLGMDE